MSTSCCQTPVLKDKSVVHLCLCSAQCLARHGWRESLPWLTTTKGLLVSCPSTVYAQVFCILEHHLKAIREEKRGNEECYSKKFCSVLRTGDSEQLGDLF